MVGKTVQFARTPIMSSYLVAFAVGDLGYKETVTKDGIIVRMYTLPENVKHADFAVECARKALEYYTEFFDIPYPIKKCDIIAIPDFSMGAMENWGLVTFREVLLIVDPERTSAVAKSRVALVIAHELAHMWFGNLVSMKWWTDLWLKEGFATFMEYLFVDQAYPEFQVMMRFVHDEVARALELDALKSSHPIEVPIANPNELEEIYDAITYAKGTSINRMLYSHLGHDTFRAGLQNYLKKHAYGNAITTDLWAALSEVSKQDVAPMMATFTGQMGFPVLHASVKYLEGDTAELTLTQHRFIADGSKDELNQQWQVPVTVLSEGNATATRHLLTQPTQTFTINNVKQGAWLKLNSAMTGYYIVKYSSEMSALLAKPLKDKTFQATDRFNIMSDMNALIRAGVAPVHQFLDLLSVCAVSEDNLIVWQEMDAGVSALANCMMRSTDAQLLDRFNKFVVATYLPFAEKLTWKPTDGESNSTSMLRATVLSRLGKAGHQPTIDTAIGLFRDHVDKATPLQADIRRAIYLIASIHGGKQVTEDLKKVYSESTFPEVKRAALSVIGASKEPGMATDCLNFHIFSGSVRKQDMVFGFYACGGSKQGQDAAWSFFKTNMHKLVEIFGDANSMLFQRIFKMGIECQCDEAVAKEAESLIGASAYACTLDRPLRQACEQLRLNTAMLNRDVPVANKWLTDNKY